MDVGDLLQDGLPFNRKERFFTGTIFPALVLGSGVERLERLLNLLGIEGERPEWTDGKANIQVFTEYGVAESILPSDSRFAQVVLGRDTPDIVIYQPGKFLLGVEAKMFDRPSRADLLGQVQRQQDVLLPLATGLALAPEQVHQVVLLPEQTATGYSVPLLAPIVTLTWQELAQLYGDGPTWAVDTLDYALRHWDWFASTGKGAGADVYLSGGEIARDRQNLVGAVMGRNGGWYGKAFALDQQHGKWRMQSYQVRYSGPTPNGNWFPVQEFIDRVTPHGEVDPLTCQLVSWQVARDLIETCGDQVLVRELHPGGGQYDVLALGLADAIGGEFRSVQLNRVGGIHFMPDDLDPVEWSAVLTEDGRAGLLARITDHLGLVGLSEQDPAPGLLCTVETIVAVLELASKGLLGRQLVFRSAGADSSEGSSESGWYASALRAFPVSESFTNRNARLLDADDWRWWLLFDQADSEPLALLDLQGRLWLPGDMDPAADVEAGPPGALAAALIHAASSAERQSRSLSDDEVLL